VETRSAPPSIGGRYRIDGLLGEGGMARVFDAFDERLERRVAVKVLRTETLAVPGMRQRFQQEALIAARLVHPHIVAVLDFGENTTWSYLVMERLPGSTLRDEIVARGPLSIPRVQLVLAETLTALAAAHRFGVLHRDIKPSNILLQQDGHTKITDFGVAKSFDVRLGPGPSADDTTTTGVVLGTPGYLSPERRAGSPATVQSDLYSVGAVMVEALTGQRPGPDAAPTSRLPPRLCDVARRALAIDPRERFTSAAEMLTALRLGAVRTDAATRPYPSATATPPVRAPLPAPGDAGVTAPRPTTPQPRRTTRRHRFLVAAIGTLALAVSLVVLLEQASQPTGPAASASKHAVVRPQVTASTDTEGTAIAAAAASLAGGGLPGDAALARALDATAAQPPGASRQASAQQVLALAQELLDEGGITSGQFQVVVNVLQPTGATVTTTTTTTVTAPSPPPSEPFYPGRGHGRDGMYGYGSGYQG
jgi:tRNA A-37 threonylcarbamoyl transferase component Bud32